MAYTINIDISQAFICWQVFSRSIDSVAFSRFWKWSTNWFQRQVGVEFIQIAEWFSLCDVKQNLKKPFHFIWAEEY